MVRLHAHYVAILLISDLNILWWRHCSNTSSLNICLHIKNIGSHVWCAKSISSLINHSRWSKVATKICRYWLKWTCLQDVSILIFNIKWTFIDRLLFRLLINVVVWLSINLSLWMIKIRFVDPGVLFHEAGISGCTMSDMRHSFLFDVSYLSHVPVIQVYHLTHVTNLFRLLTIVLISWSLPLSILLHWLFSLLLLWLVLNEHLNNICITLHQSLFA